MKQYRIKAVTILSLLFISLSVFSQKHFSLKSPDENLEVKIEIGQRITYTLIHGQDVVLHPSAIAIETAGGKTFGINAGVVKEKRNRIKQTISAPVYKKNEIEDDCNELVISFKEGFSLVFRAYNEGAAYRFLASQKQDFVVRNEVAEFNVGATNKAYIPYVKTDKASKTEQLFNSFENTYVYTAVNEWEGERLAFLPLLVETVAHKKLVITEADLEDYPGMFLENPERGSILNGYFAPYPKKIEQGGHNMLQDLVLEREDYIAKCKAKTRLPWRIITVAAEDKDLLDNDLVYKLASPGRVEDVSWIKPGKVAWEWWNDWNLYGVDFETGINNETYKYYIDFASKYGMEYVILDEGWAVSRKADLFEVIPEIDLRELVKYADQRNVGLILWAGYRAFNQDMERICKHYSEMGIKGFKVDFMDRDDQPMVNFHYEAARIAAKYKLLLDFHGTYKPTGLQRTYPNVINFEGVHGLETMKWSENTVDQVTYDVTIPFIRMLAGPMDYTQGAMKNAIRKNYHPVFSEAMSQGTRSRQLAQYIIFEAPLNMLCDSPSNYEREEESTKFIASVPTVWDETLALDGKVGEYATIARRKGEVWYVASITNWDKRSVQLDLSFLKAGNYQAEIFRDGVNAMKVAKDYKKEIINIPAHRKLEISLAGGGGCAVRIFPSNLSVQINRKDYSLQVDSILHLMTLEEKVGQMIQYSDDRLQTGPSIHHTDQFEEIKKGRVGSMFNVMSVERIKSYQDVAMQSRLKIPLLFGLDVVHGMKTTFPIPLAEAASFDFTMIEETARIAAVETSAYGIHWTFAPMVDISRDARWGRVMEGAGEDPWLGSQIAKARIKGFQGENYDDAKSIMACAKHFAAYGAAVAGKDYAEADISETTLHQVYLPPFRAAVEANVATMMNGFNEINGIPANAHKELQRDILKGKWGFEGFMVSDWGSIGEIATHGMAKDNKEATKLAILAGCDMDMHSMSYKRNLVDLVNEGEVEIRFIDDAVRRILTKKFELGLFEDPYRYCYRGKDMEDASIMKKHRTAARLMGAKSIVLLKNENVLPIRPEIKKIALVGPLNQSRIDMLGNWNAAGEEKEVVSIYEGLRAALPDAEIVYMEGYDLETNELKPLPSLTHFDMIIISVGERALDSGEARSKVDINVHPNQQALVKHIKEQTDKPVVMLLMSGRPLIFSVAEPFADAIAVTWWLGSEAGNSIADVLTGKYNPSGKLPMTFPRHVGQCPIYYNHKRTGRPWKPNEKYVSGYMDETVLPAYPFGFGLSYTQFEIGDPIPGRATYTINEPITVQVKVKNIGKQTGVETVQLYLQDVVSSISRPVMELCGVQQVELEPGEERWIEFVLTAETLGFYDKSEFKVEGGEFRFY